MSLFHPEHEYLCKVHNNEDPMMLKQPVSINGNRIEIPMGVDTKVKGMFLRSLEEKGRYKPGEPVVDAATGQQKAGPLRWIPRFSISMIQDLTTKTTMEMPPVPSGAVLLDEFGKPPLSREDLEDKGQFVLQRMCAERKIHYSKQDTKELLIAKLLGDEGNPGVTL